jgi:mannose-6-phosphate isomerase-like protein (cupin superfamily)
MAYVGQVLDNPVTGERIVFHQTAADTNGALLRFELTVAPDGHVPGPHVHPSQEERFEISAGAMKFRRGFEKVVAGRGDTVVVPSGTVHRFANAGNEPAHALVEVRPALKMEQLLETSHSLALLGRTNRKGMPKLLDLALFMREFQDEVRAPFVPWRLVRALTAPLAWLAVRRGLDRSTIRQDQTRDRARPRAA